MECTRARSFELLKKNSTSYSSLDEGYQNQGISHAYAKRPFQVRKEMDAHDKFCSTEKEK